MVGKGLATVAILVAVALAGCTEPEQETQDVLSIEETDEVVLEQGKGAIAGLLVDDRFRPLANGEVLLKELGLQTVSNENGEFFFVDLEPGKYTLRATVAYHEAAPFQAVVEEGLFAEASVIARRIANTDGVVITEELAAFVSCNVNVPIAAVYCGAAVMPDLSGDTQRWQMDLDYRQHGHNVTNWVVELRTDKEAEKNGAVKLIVRNGAYFVNDVITEGSYLWTSMQYNGTSLNDVEDRNGVWTNDRSYLVQVWAQGLYKEETQGAPGLSYDSRGVGVQLGLKAKLVSSLFLYDPGMDLTELEYCTLC